MCGARYQSRHRYSEKVRDIRYSLPDRQMFVTTWTYIIHNRILSDEAGIKVKKSCIGRSNGLLLKTVLPSFWATSMKNIM